MKKHFKPKSNLELVLDSVNAQSNCVYVNTFMGYFMDYHSTIADSSNDNSKNKYVKIRIF